MIEFTIAKRCPSIQGDNIGKKLTEWRAYICESLCQQGFIEGDYNSPEEGIRRFVLLHLDGPCCMEMEFRLRATKHVTDLDNMLLFILACFRTEMTSEAKDIAKDMDKAFGKRLWPYYVALGFPGNLDFWEVLSSRRDGEAEDLTTVRVRRLTASEALQYGASEALS